MQGLQSAISLMTKNCFMASIDFCDAYYSIPIKNEDRKYFRFIFKNQKYQYNCLPNGYSLGPYKFTKVSKMLFKHLKDKGHLNTNYIDDSFLSSITYDECINNIHDTLTIARKAGFVIHPEKSVIVPTHVIEYLGFILNSIDMTVRLTPRKIDDICEKIRNVIKKPRNSIQEISELVGKLVATFPGVKFGKLYYRQLDNEKTAALKLKKGNYEAEMKISDLAKKDLHWWLEKLPTSHANITLINPDITLYTDASNFAWGGHFENKKTGGQWHDSETQCHINEKELLAVLFSLNSLCKNKHNIHIKIMSDNSTTVHYINNMGGRKLDCNTVARKIWEWAIERNIWLSCSYIPGKDNCEADRLSRTLHSNVEWRLDTCIFKVICEEFGPINFDLFASRLTNQVSRYASWMPDPGAELCDAMSFDWKSVKGYAFPPFSMVGKVLQKIECDKCTIVLVVPQFRSQPWFPKMLHMLVDFPLLIRRTQRMLTNPVNPQETPIRSPLMVCRVSGLINNTLEFQKQLPTYCAADGAMEPKNNMQSILDSGKCFVIKDKLISCRLI